jgi:TPP-dependent pyruvate/acetoin dehydrogenase alpha subunit
VETAVVNGMDGPLRLLDSEGRLLGDCPLSAEQLEEALRLMLLSRALDELAIKLQRMNRLGVYGPVLGQEAAVVGSALALDPSRDWMVPASREQPAYLHHGLPLDRLLAGYMGRITHSRIPEGVNLLPRQQAIGSQLTQAAGLAWALKLRRLRAATIVYLGDGAASEGDFHEAANLAGVQRVPLVFLLINNQYAISTPASRQTAAPSLALRAAGYGFPGVAVDGNDVLAVYAATARAVERALAGEGPTLVECLTYRVGFHNTSDNPAEYRDEEEVEAARRLDPLLRLSRYAASVGAWSEAREEELRTDAAAHVQAAYRKVSAMPQPGPEEVYEHVYATLPERVRRQRDGELP